MAILRILTKGFFLIAIACGAFAVVNFVLPLDDIVAEDDVSGLLKAANMKAPGGVVEKQSSKDFSLFSKKNIFDGQFMDDSPAAALYDPSSLEKRDDVFLKRYRLAGILMDDNPQAVFEESGGGRSLISGVGDKVGDAQVKEISSGRVIMERQGKVFEMGIDAGETERKTIFKR